MESELEATHLKASNVQSDLEVFTKQLAKNEEKTKSYLSAFLNKIASINTHFNRSSIEHCPVFKQSFHESVGYIPQTKKPLTLTPSGLNDSTLLEEIMTTTRETQDPLDKMYLGNIDKHISENVLTPGRQTCSKKLHHLPTNSKTKHSNITPGTSQTCSKKLHPPLTHNKTSHRNRTPGTSQTCSKKLHHPLTHSKTSHRNRTPGTSQTCSKKLHHLLTNSKTSHSNRTPGTSQTCSKKLHHPLTNTKTKHLSSWSVSLQASKYRDTLIEGETSISNQNVNSHSPKNKPLNSKPKAKNESYEDFFIKNIDFYKEHMKKYYGYQMLRSAPSRPVVPPPMIYSGRLSSEQVAMLEAEFTKGKTLHSTDLTLLAAEMAANERDVQAWYQQRMAAWRREQGLSDCFGQI